ncbi:MAG: ABC transporter ATP-binding protein [Myxococcota bacterium]
MANDQIIKVEKVGFSYGKTEILKDINFSLNKGEIVALLGLNGAGKTTIFKMLTGQHFPLDGKIKVYGLHPAKSRKKLLEKVGILPEISPLDLEFTVEEHLEYAGKIYGYAGVERKNRNNYLLQRFEIMDVFYQKAGNLSKGYRQRLALALALYNDPPLVILDEPGSGLDPRQLESFHNYLKLISNKKTIILSTHIIADVKKLANRVIVLASGRKTFEGSYPGDNALRAYLLGENPESSKEKIKNDSADLSMKEKFSSNLQKNQSVEQKNKIKENNTGENN